MRALLLLLLLTAAQSEGFRVSFTNSPAATRKTYRRSICALSHDSYVVERLTRSKVGLARRFYRDQNYRDKVRGDDVVFVLRFTGDSISSRAASERDDQVQALAHRGSQRGSIVAAVRLTKKKIFGDARDEAAAPVYLLQSLCVDASLRRRGLASRLLANEGPLLEMLNQYGALCYCFPYTPLAELYRRAGFCIATPNEEPGNPESLPLGALNLPHFISTEFEMVSRQQARKKRPVDLMYRRGQQKRD
mmetsp:Transcript_65682/g.148217  ORF Transcript_65682/g.148217 Transcript_65682/m.148217 type:complete len:248 (-) Transcript_65682:485-1228(-)